MPFPLSLRELGPWVGGFALMGAAPRFLLPFAPADFLADVVVARGDRAVTVRDVALWLPNTMAGAAVVALAVGLVFAAGHWLVGRGPLAGAFAHLRFAASVTGIFLIVGCILLVWVSLVGGEVLDWIDLVIAGLAVGTGLATGAAYYTR